MKKIFGVLFLSTLFCTWAVADTCVGHCGVDVGNGDVTPAPGFSSYQFVTTNGGVTGGGTIPGGTSGYAGGGHETDGSTLTSSVFAATAGSQVQFNFNFVTSDGSGFPDYAWAELEDGLGNPVAVLFTARTEPTGNTSPGQALPTPMATLTPPTTPIMPGSGTSCSTTCEFANGSGPVWSELGGYSGACWASGCGLTGWIEANYTISADGVYQLAFGVTNTNDTIYDTGLAIDGAVVNGNPVFSPEPGTLALFGTGLFGLAGTLRRRMNK